MNIWDIIKSRLIDDAGIVLVKVIDKKGSAPRSQGAIMAVFKAGDISGTIGGGKIEAEAIKHARDIFNSKNPDSITFYLSGADAAETEMICGGEVTLSFDYITSDTLHLFESEYKGEDLLIFGAGHVSQKLASVAEGVGFKTTIIDDREEFVNSERFPNSNLALIETLENPLEKVKVTKESYVVIVTRGHLHDKTVLKETMKVSPYYIGMIGSKRKRDLIYKDLIENEGISSQSLKTVHCPIGLEILAETPEEIAISIVAELIKARAEHE